MAGKKAEVEINTIKKIQEDLNKRFPPEKESRRDGKKNQQYDYVPAPEVVNRLNEVFGIRWSFEEIESFIIENYFVKRIKLSVADPEDPSRVWSREGSGSHKLFWGSQDPGDAAKAAQSKALAKAASYFGVALYMWGVDNDDEKMGEVPPPGAQTGQNPQMVVVNPGGHNNVPPGAQTMVTPSPLQPNNNPYPPPPPAPGNPPPGQPNINQTPPPPPPQPAPLPPPQNGMPVGGNPTTPSPMLRNPEAPLFAPPPDQGGNPPPKPVPFPTMQNASAGQTTGPGTPATASVGVQAVPAPNRQGNIEQGMIQPHQLHGIMGAAFKIAENTKQRKDPVVLVKEVLGDEVAHIQHLNELTWEQAQRANEALNVQAGG